jgi:hypothetical protein
MGIAHLSKFSCPLKLSADLGLPNKSRNRNMVSPKSKVLSKAKDTK